MGYCQTSQEQEAIAFVSKSCGKQSSIFGRACIEHARIKSSDNDHNTWNSENIDDEHFLGELIQFTINPCRLTNLVQTTSSHELLYPSGKVAQGTRKFKAVIEDWETSIKIRQILILNKYGGMRYIDPDKRPPKAYSVYEYEAKVYKEEAWCLYGVPKGLDGIPTNIDKFELIFINNDFLIQIKITEQTSKEVIDENEIVVDCQEVWSKHFKREIPIWNDLANYGPKNAPKKKSKNPLNTSASKKG